MTAYDPMGYVNADGQCGLPLCSHQHQQNLVLDPSFYQRCDDFFDCYKTVTQHPTLPIPPSSGSSELGNALVDISMLEPQPMSRASISLPSPPLPSQPAPKHKPSEDEIGLNPEKRHGVTASSQPFSPMVPLGSPLLTDDHAHSMREDQGSFHVSMSSMAHTSTPLYRHSSLYHY